MHTNFQRLREWGRKLCITYSYWFRKNIWWVKYLKAIFKTSVNSRRKWYKGTENVLHCHYWTFLFCSKVIKKRSKELIPKIQQKTLRVLILERAIEKVSILLSNSLPIYMVTFWSKYLEKEPFDYSPIIILQIGCTKNIFTNSTWKESI